MVGRTLVGVLLVCAWACGGGDSDPSGPVDASADIDSSPLGETPCGDDTCAPSEVCVACNCGGPTTLGCQPAPSECGDDRTCDCLADELCPEISTSCVDQSPNQILCDSELD